MSDPQTHASRRTAPVLLAFVLAVLTPALLAFNVPPSSTFLNQAAAFVGWGVVVFACARLAPPSPRGSTPEGALPLMAAFVVLAACALASSWGRGLPWSFGLSTLGWLGACVLVWLVGAQGARDGQAGVLFKAFCIALMLAASLSTLIAITQYFLPNWADGDWIARPSVPSRVGANLRQPNHLSSLLLAAIAGSIWLHGAESRRLAGGLPWRACAATAALVGILTFGLVLTVSRTGTVCILLLAIWAVLDRDMPRFLRILLWLLPVWYAACWVGVDAWSNAAGHAFAGESQLNKADLSSSRFGIWSNTWALVRANPWFGVGWGEFNFAWTLTPFPGRPIAFFDHTHNLPLQFAVEIGLPLAVLTMVLLLAALWAVSRRARDAVDEDRAVARCALVMVLMMGIHSMLEYPLWYAYFLLPTAFAFGIALGARPVAAVVSRVGGDGRRLRGALVAGGAVLALGGLYSVADYWRVVQIYAPPADAEPLEARIADGQRSTFFGYHADYAAVTTAKNPSTVMAAFDRATHHLLDARLMVAWSKAFAEQGDLERARYLAQRLKEFRHPIGDTFFAECKDTSKEPLPFQCTPPTRSFTYRDFLPAKAR